jgi:hypothetical protein
VSDSYLIILSNLIDIIHVLRDSQHLDLLTLEEWTSVLKLSSMWHFQKIRALAIKKMEGISMDLIDKINIARRFEILTWLVPALNALVQREKPIDLLEGNRLGMEWVLKVAEVRECNPATQERTCTHCSYKGSPRCNSCNSTTANRCGSCNTHLPAATIDLGKRGARSSIDFSKEIREVFDVV